MSNVSDSGRPLLFLDIDGVLNDHQKLASGVCGSRPSCVYQLNRVIAETDCNLVVSSAWRYMVLMGELTEKGFMYLLQTHGVDAWNRLAGVLRKDAERQGEPVTDRGRQVSEWLLANGANYARAYAVVDDLDLGISDCGHPFVQTNGKLGLTRHDADRLIDLLQWRLWA